MYIDHLEIMKSQKIMEHGNRMEMEVSSWENRLRMMMDLALAVDVEWGFWFSEQWNVTVIPGISYDETDKNTGDMSWILFYWDIYTYIYIHLYIYRYNPTFRTGKSLCLDMVPSLVWRAGKSPPDLFFPTEDQFFTDHLSVDLIKKSNKIP